MLNPSFNYLNSILVGTGALVIILQLILIFPSLCFPQVVMAPTVFFFPCYCTVVCSTSVASQFLFVPCLVFMGIIQHSIPMTMWAIINPSGSVPSISIATSHTWSCSYSDSRISGFDTHNLIILDMLIGAIDNHIIVMHTTNKSTVTGVHLFLFYCYRIIGCIINTYTNR